ncbi:MAG TPA: carboxypeptidase regulatory-like domain-containing protein [Pyrinomonadaceae bacterium]|nr:carboxypeptidase regulatory-like domain-containing protein [Pyrinomonadaceae bacterium]
MNRTKTIVATLAFVLLAASTASFAQGRTTGGIKGKVRLENKKEAAGVAVTIRQGEREVAHAVTDSKGAFVISNLAPGVYGLTFRKPGLSVGTLEGIEVRAGKTKSLPDRLILTVNEASIARLAGSVFTGSGRSFPGVPVELALVNADGTARKIDGRLTSESGQFAFRLSPDRATYRVTIKPKGAEPQTKDVEIDGALIYRVSFSVARPPEQ